MIFSPYTPGAGATPPALAGRDDLLAEAEAVLARAAHFAAPGSAPLVWTGVRGVGKTVALGELRRRARRSFATVHVTADREGHLAPRLAEAVAATLADEQVDRSGRRWARLAERLAAFDISVSVAGVLTVGTSARQGATQGGVARDDLRRLVQDACDQVVDAGRSGLLITVDEVQEPPAADLTALVSLLQDLAGGERPVVVVLAGLPATPERLMAAGSFAERFAYQRLRNLTPAAATAALVAPAQEQQVTWTVGAADLVLSLSRGAPFLLQLYADGVWRAARPERGGRLEIEQARTGARETEGRLWEGQYRGRWARATPAEQILLAAVAACLGPDGTAAVSEVAARLDRPVQGLGPARAALVDKGLVEAPARGLLAFTVPGFEAFVRAQGGSGHREIDR